MPSLSIRKTIPILIVAPLFVAIGFMGALSIAYGRRFIHQLSGDLMTSTTNRIQDQVTSELQEAILINALNASAIKAGELDLQARDDLGRYFASQVNVARSTNYVYLGDQQAYFVGSRLQNGERFTVISQDNTPGRTETYQISERGMRSLSPIETNKYDPRERPWYKDARAAKAPIWSDVYLGFTTKELLITAAHPIYDSNNQLLGVLGADVFITEINRFLKALEIGKTGELFILEKNGMLVASSLGETISDKADPPTGSSELAGEADKIARILSFDSPETLIRESSTQLLEDYGDLSLIQENIRIQRTVDNQRMFIAARPLTNNLGLDWLVVVVIPTRDFTGPLRTQSFIILVFGALALGSALALGWVVARWVVTPILRLNKAAVDVKSQTFTPNDIEDLIEREDEIGQLAHVFADMAEIIGEREESMEEQLKYLRLQAPIPGVRRSLDLKDLRALQQKAKVIRSARTHQQEHL